MPVFVIATILPTHTVSDASWQLQRTILDLPQFQRIYNVRSTLYKTQTFYNVAKTVVLICSPG